MIAAPTAAKLAVASAIGSFANLVTICNKPTIMLSLNPLNTVFIPSIKPPNKFTKLKPLNASAAPSKPIFSNKNAIPFISKSAGYIIKVLIAFFTPSNTPPITELRKPSPASRDCVNPSINPRIPCTIPIIIFIGKKITLPRSENTLAKVPNAFNNAGKNDLAIPKNFVAD